MAIHSDAREGMETLAGSLSGLIPKSLSCWIILYWRRMKYGGFREEVISMNIKNLEVVIPSASAFKRWRPKGIMEPAAEPSREFMFARPTVNFSHQSTLFLEMPLPILSKADFRNGKKTHESRSHQLSQNPPRTIAGSGVTPKTASF